MGYDETTGARTDAVVAPPPRRRGRPAKLSRDRILAVARDLPPESLTMQSVAVTLGVDRKALNYYVSGRDGLLELVALDAFETEIARIRFTPATDWRELLRACAIAIRTALVRVGGLISAIDFGGVSGTDALGTVEQIFGALVEAGFDAHDAGRTMTLLAEIAHAAAHETLTATARYADPQAHNVVDVLAGVPGDRFPTVRRVAAARAARSHLGEQFDFDLTVLIAGLEKRLRTGPENSGRRPTSADSAHER